MHRREFLASSLMAPVAIKAFAPAVAAAETPPIREATFRRLVGSRFSVARGDWQGTAILTEVREGPKAPGLEQFSTVFQPEGVPPPSPDLYQVHHTETGTLSLRLDRTATGADVAVFNLLV